MHNILSRSKAVPFAAAFAISTIAMSTSALAHVGCASTSHVTSQHNSTRDVINEQHSETRQAIQVMTDTLVKTLTEHVRENSNHSDRAVEAAKRISDAEQLNATDRMRQQIRAEAESGKFDPNPFMCMLATMFSGSGGVDDSVGATPIMQSVSSFLNGDHSAVAAGGVELLKHTVDEKAKYEGFRSSPNASTDISLLLREPTLDYDDPLAAGAYERIIKNAINPLPPRKATGEELNTPAGIARVAAREKIMARQDAATEIFEMTLNMRQPILEDPDGERGPLFQTMALEDSAYNRAVPSKLSELSQLDIRTVFHYAPKGDRFEKMESFTKEMDWLAEIHNITAINARINYLRLELENRNAIVNALILASMNQQ